MTYWKSAESWGEPAEWQCEQPTCREAGGYGGEAAAQNLRRTKSAARDHAVEMDHGVTVRQMVGGYLPEGLRRTVSHMAVTFATRETRLMHGELVRLGDVVDMPDGTQLVSLERP